MYFTISTYFNYPDNHYPKIKNILINSQINLRSGKIITTRENQHKPVVNSKDS